MARVKGVTKIVTLLQRFGTKIRCEGDQCETTIGVIKDHHIPVLHDLHQISEVTIKRSGSKIAVICVAE